MRASGDGRIWYNQTASDIRELSPPDGFAGRMNRSAWSSFTVSHAEIGGRSVPWSGDEMAVREAQAAV